MAYYYGPPHPITPWERSTNAPWGGVYFGESRRRPESHSTPRFDPTNILEVKYPRMYSGEAPILTQAEVLGSFSVDSERNFGHDKSLLHTIDPKYIPQRGKMQVNLDLNAGWDKYIKYNGRAKEKFQNLLRWILKNKERLKASQQRLSVDFVSEIGNINRVMRTPYSLPNGWTVLAIEFKGSIYLINFPKKTIQANGQGNHAPRNGPDLEEIRKWGHTFNHYMKGGDPEEGVNPNEEYFSVLKTTVGETSLIYAPAVDCSDPARFKDDFKDLEAFVALRCCKKVTGRNMQKNHKRFKLNHWWLDNQLMGIPRMLVGYQNDDGIVQSLEMLKTDEIPIQAAGEWEPNVCLNFLELFLEFVKERVRRNPGMTLIFEYEPRGNIHCRKLSGTMDILPKWYTDELFTAISDSKASKS